MENNKTSIERFLKLKEANGQSKHTIISQRIVLEKLDRFLLGKLFREAEEDDIVNFISEMRQKHAESYVQLMKIVVKSFYRHLYGMKRHETPPQVENIQCGGNHKNKLPIRPEDMITKEDLTKFVKLCDNFRDKAIVVTLYESAARVGEFVAIDICHLKFDDRGVVLIIDGKTGARRLRLIESVPFLHRWIESHPRRGEIDSPLWCSIRKPFGRVDPGTIRMVLSKIKDRCGVKKPMNPHSFRHSRLTELAKFLSDSKLKVFAGWTANSDMAGVYVHLTGKDLDDDLLEIAGVLPKEESPKESPLRVKQCPRCNASNNGVAEFCHLCGRPFNEAMVVEKTLEAQVLKDDIANLKEILKHSGDVTDEMWGTIDELKNEIRELKAKDLICAGEKAKDNL